MRQLRYWQLFNVSPETFSVCMVPKIARSGAEEMAQELRALAVHSKDLVWSLVHTSNVSGEDLITAQHQNLHLTSGWLSRTEIQLERWIPTGRSATAAPVVTVPCLSLCSNVYHWVEPLVAFLFCKLALNLQVPWKLLPREEAFRSVPGQGF